MHNSIPYRQQYASPQPYAFRQSMPQTQTLRMVASPSQMQRPLIQPMNRSFQMKDSTQSQNSNTINNSAIHYQSTYSQSFNRFDQAPIQVVDLQQVEEPWRQRVAYLEAELEKARHSKQQNQYMAESDDEESELSQAYSQIQQLVNSIRNLQEDIQTIQEKADQKDNLIQSLENQLLSKEKEIEELNEYVAELNKQLEDNNNEEKQKYLFDEINTWKQKFIEQNKEFHEKQEELMMLQAELDNLKNQQVMITKTSDYKNSK